MHHPLILTIDLGTTSTRAALYDGRANPVSGASVQIPNRLETDPDGRATFDARTLLATTVDAIDQVLVRARLPEGAIAALTMAGFVGNVLGLDADGQPITPVYTYADTRNAAAVGDLRRRFGREFMDAAHDRTGCMLHTSYLPPRFAWLAAAEPDLFAQVARWVSVAEWIQQQLTGALAVSVSVAAWTGLLDRRTLTWDSTWLDRLPANADQLSPIVDSLTALGTLTAAWQTRWPALANAQVYPAVGDGAAANIGSGCDKPGRIALTVGTTGAMRMVVPPTLAHVPRGLWLYRVDSARALLGGATTEGGNLFAWLRDTLTLPAGDALEASLRTARPAHHGLTVLPFIAGERAPGWHEAARATVSGIGLHTTAVDLVQGALEGIAYRFARIHQLIVGNTDPGSQTIVASGGALLRSPAWLQIFADVLNQPVVALRDAELTSRGLALLGLEALGAIGTSSDLPPTFDREFTPDAAAHAAHAAARERQDVLYAALLE